LRIAISGTHYSGKSTLVEALSEALAGYSTVEEPYRLMEEEGYEFAESPSLEDFELQLERAVRNLDASMTNVIFDRSPLDILAYIFLHPDVEMFDFREWMPRIQAAIRNLDVIVYVPMDEAHRIVLPLSQDDGYRRRVDEKIRDIINGELFDFDVEILNVAGNTQTRVKQVLRYMHDKMMHR
jgi:hypothetical protein